MLHITRLSNRTLTALGISAGLTLLAFTALAQPGADRDREENTDDHPCHRQHARHNDGGYGPGAFRGRDHHGPPPREDHEGYGGYRDHGTPPPHRGHFAQRGDRRGYGPSPRGYEDRGRRDGYGPPPPPPHHRRQYDDRGDGPRGYGRPDAAYAPPRPPRAESREPELTFDDLDKDGDGLLSRREASLIVHVDGPLEPKEEPVLPPARD